MASRTPKYLFLLLVLGCCTGGLLLILSITLANNAWWIWPAPLLALLPPITLGFIVQRSNKKYLAACNILATTFSIGGITLYITLFPSAQPIINTTIYLLAGFFLLIATCFLIWKYAHILLQPISILLCTEGCVIFYRWGRIQVLHWNNITTLWQTTTYTRLVCQDGTRFTIEHHWPNASATRSIIANKVVRRIRLRTMEQLEVGQAVPFGPYTLSQQGITVGSTTWTWGNIHECEYMNNSVALIAHDHTRIAHFPTTRLPNIAVFVAMVNTIAREHLTVPSTL